jgi:hypothetical protein
MYGVHKMKIGKKAIELPMQVLLIGFVVGIVVLLIFFAFQKSGIINFKQLLNKFLFEPAGVR